MSVNVLTSGRFGPASSPASYIGTGTAYFTTGIAPLSHTIPLPAGVVAGDLVFLVAYCQYDLTNDPAGWTRLINLDFGGDAVFRVRLWSKFIGASEANPTITVMYANQPTFGKTYAFRGPAVFNIQDIQSRSINGNDATGGGAPVTGMKLNSCDPTTAQGVIFQFGVWYTPSPAQYAWNGTLDGAGFTKVDQVNDAAGMRYAAGYYIPPAPGSYLPFNFDLTGSPTPYPGRWCGQVTGG